MCEDPLVSLKDRYTRLLRQRIDEWENIKITNECLGVDKRMEDMRNELRAVRNELKVRRSTAMAALMHDTATPASRESVCLAPHLTPGGCDDSVASALTSASGMQNGVDEEEEDEEAGLPKVDGAGGRRVDDVVAVVSTLGVGHAPISAAMDIVPVPCGSKEEDTQPRRLSRKRKLLPVA